VWEQNDIVFFNGKKEEKRGLLMRQKTESKQKIQERKKKC